MEGMKVRAAPKLARTFAFFLLRNRHDILCPLHNFKLNQEQWFRRDDKHNSNLSIQRLEDRKDFTYYI